MTDPLIPRASDPISSVKGVRKAGWLTTRVLVCAQRLDHDNPGAGFTDDDLHETYERMFLERKDRGAIARARLNLVRRGLLEPCDPYHPVLRHRLTQETQP